jgi:SOS-response transcriptional repressor LexA
VKGPDAEARKLLTARQSKWLEALRDHYARYGMPPTLRQLCEAMGLSAQSTTAAAHALRKLANAGYLSEFETRGGHSRYIPVDRPGDGAAPALSPRVARAVAELRRQAAELHRRAEEMEKIADELEAE